eukprot:10017367-Lingulodinium_polyedra.AAC.1
MFILTLGRLSVGGWVREACAPPPLLQFGRGVLYTPSAPTSFVAGPSRPPAILHVRQPCAAPWRRA